MQQPKPAAQPAAAGARTKSLGGGITVSPPSHFSHRPVRSADIRYNANETIPTPTSTTCSASNVTRLLHQDSPVRCNACTLYTVHHLNNNGPDPDRVVLETSEKGLAVGGPCERGAFGAAGVGGELVKVGLEVVDGRPEVSQHRLNLRHEGEDSLRLEVEDLDRRSGGGAEPVPVGGEDERVDNVAGLERVEVLALVEVPKHGDAVLATGGGEGSIGGDGEGVDVAGVAVVVGLELALGELPDLVVSFARLRHAYAFQMVE